MISLDPVTGPCFQREEFIPGMTRRFLDVPTDQFVISYSRSVCGSCAGLIHPVCATYSAHTVFDLIARYSHCGRSKYSQHPFLSQCKRKGIVYIIARKKGGGEFEFGLKFRQWHFNHVRYRVRTSCTVHFCSLYWG